MLINKELFKKSIPFVSLLILSAILMFILKNKKNELGQTINDSKNALVALVQGLRPLAFQTKITNEDLFNFALFQSLPIDENREKILVLNTEGENQSFEIRNLDNVNESNNFNKFIEYLNLKEPEVNTLDSILNTYKKPIYSSVLISSDETYAVNPELQNTQRLILADLIEFSQKIDPKKSAQLFNQKFETNQLSNLLSKRGEDLEKDFIIISPKTVTATKLDWNNKDLERQIAIIENKISNSPDVPAPPPVPINFKINPEEKKKSVNKKFEFEHQSDSNWQKIVIPVDQFKLAEELNGNVRISLDELSKKLRDIKINIPEIEKNVASSKLKKAINNHRNKTGIVNPYSIINETMNIVNESLRLMPKGNSEKDWEEYGRKMDSIGKKIEKVMKEKYQKSGSKPTKDSNKIDLKINSVEDDSLKVEKK
ncbi:MAG: hypothetical protein KF816_11795 [Melioribacteraceae bacterium]|jgi:hypothetical protein|nr:hypothetical protein [Melioribacteraceae bacterium]